MLQPGSSLVRVSTGHSNGFMPCHHCHAPKVSFFAPSVSMYKNIIIEDYYNQIQGVVKQNSNLYLIFPNLQDRLSPKLEAEAVQAVISSGTGMQLKVIIADDHAIIREGLKSLLEAKGIKVLDIARNGREALEKAIALEPDIMMMDISMPDLNGVEATARIREEVPHTRVIALSMHSGKNMVDKMFASGASGYVLKESAFDEIYDAIQGVIRGNFYLTPSIARMYVDDHTSLGGKCDRLPKFTKISKKEREILQLVAEGVTTREIAEKLGVSIKTVETHRRNIMKKLNIFSVAGLTKYAIKEGIISLD